MQDFVQFPIEFCHGVIDSDIMLSSCRAVWALFMSFFGSLGGNQGSWDCFMCKKVECFPVTRLCFEVH